MEKIQLIYCLIKKQIQNETARKFCWLVGYFGFNGPLRQYFSLYRAVSQREGERGERIDESKNVQTTPTYCKRSRPLPYCHQNCRTPRHWKFTQHHRTTQPPPKILFVLVLFSAITLILSAGFSLGLRKQIQIPRDIFCI